MAAYSQVTTAVTGNTLTAAIWNNEFAAVASSINSITNAQVNASAGIVYSKLSLTGGIVNADISGSAAIVESKITFSGSGHGHTGGTDGKIITVRRGYGFFLPDVASVANDVSWNPTVPAAQTATGLYVYSRTAPSGSSLTIRIYNVTQAEDVATVSITSGSSTAKTTSMTNAALTADDVLRMDITAVGSSTAGSNVSAVLDTTQP